MINTSHMHTAFATASLLALLAADATAQCGGVRPAFEWHTEGGVMYFTDVTDHAFQLPDSITWTSISGDHAAGTDIFFEYQTAGIDTVTLSVWRNACATATTAVVPHGGQADHCLSPVYGTFFSASTGNNAVAFYDASSTGGQQVVEFWDFGDGLIDLSTDPSHFYLYPGAYDVSHSISTVDSSTLCLAGRGEHVYVDGNTSTCDTSLFLSMSANSLGGPTSFEAAIVVFNPALEITNSVWAFGDGQVDVSSGPNTIHSYSEFGEYQACVTVNAFNTQTQQACFALACETVETAVVGMPEQAVLVPMRAWPMPFADELNVDGPAVLDGAQWSLYDALGRELAQGRVEGTSGLHIRTVAIHAGTYVLMVRSKAHSSYVFIVHV